MLLAMVPPMWFYIVDPKVQAIEDYRDGKLNSKVSFNNMQKATEQDKKTEKELQLFFTIVHICLQGPIAYWALFGTK